MIDPNNLGQVQITVRGGDADMMTVYDRPGRTAGEFLVQDGALIWRSYQGDEVRFTLNADGSSPIEFSRWVRLAEDGGTYTHTLKVLLPTDPFTEANVCVAGTARADRLEAPRFATFQGGWSDVYGNLGNDTLIGSDNHAYYLYAGRGNDLLRGQGRFDDYFFGDGGNDTINGLGGDDHLYGDAGKDAVIGGAGKDAVIGGAGKDAVIGGAGKDAVIGGAGDDVLFGGAGADRFVYNPNEMGADTISDHGAGDQLVFHGIAEAMIHAVQIGADVQVTIGTWAQVTVQDMQLADVIFSFI